MRKIKGKESPFRSGHADPSRVMGEDCGCDRQCSLMFQLLLQSPIRGLHTQALSKTKPLSHTHDHPSNETGGVSVGTDGFTASIDGCLEGSGKRRAGDAGPGTLSMREMKRRVCSVDDSLIA